MRQPADEQIEASRRLLRLILTRRDFVEAGLVAGVGALGLAACGGGSGNGVTTPVIPNPPPPPPGAIPDGAQAVTGTVSLPAGSTLKLTDLSVDILTQTVPVSATSGFTVGISSSGPSLALLLDASGNGVLMSVFDPGAASQTISTRTTAVALLYVMMNAFTLPAAALSQVLALLQADPAVAALDATLAQAIAADPYALANIAPTIGPALSQAAQSIIGASAQAAPVAVPVAAAAKQTGGAPALLTLNPAVPQNGITMTPDPTTTSLVISNSKRRPCRIYVYETTTVPGNPQTDISPATLVAGPLDLASVESLGLITLLKDLLTGTRPWSPVALPPVPLGLLPLSADQTTYQVVVLASSLLTMDPFEPAPAIFKDAHFTPFVPTWTSDLRWLFAVSVFGDVLIPLVAMLIGAGPLVAAWAVVAGAVTTASLVYEATYNAVLAQLPYSSVGQLRGQLATVVQNAIKNRDYYTFMLPQVQAVISKVDAKALAAQSEAQLEQRLARANSVLKVVWPLLVADVALWAADLGAVILDVYNSDMTTSWTVVLDRQKLVLQPNPPAPISSGDQVTFTVANPANTPNGTFQYDWTQTSPFATFSAVGEVNVGNQITTSELNVNLITTGSDVNPITVLVIGYDTSSGQRVEIGRAGTTVTFLLRAAITPTNRIASIGDQVVFVVTVDGTPPAGPLTYTWTLTGTGGSIGEANVVTTSVPYVTWTAGNAGQNDSLHVDVLSGTTVVAKSDVSVLVAGPPMIQFSIAGPWDPQAQPPNGQYQFTGTTGTYVGLRDVSPGGGGNDGIYMGYDLVGNSPNQSPGTFIAILLPSGAALQPGQVLSKYSNPPHANQFQFDLSNNLTNPGDPDANLVAPIGTGTLTVNAISQQTNGEWLMQYAFQVTNSNGGLISGSGIGKWGALGVPVNS